jgi:hypothetical protein
MCRPEFVKLYFMPKDKYDEEEEEDRKRRRLIFSQSAKNNDIESFMFKGQEKTVYKKLFGRFKLNESQERYRDLGEEDNEKGIFSKKTVEKFIHVADPTEECFKKTKETVATILLQHIRECYAVFELFEQLEPLVTRQLEYKVNNFCAGDDHSMQEFENLVVELRDYKELVQ